MITSWNIRYSLYCLSNGHSEEEQLEIDRGEWPGGCMCGYIIWINGKWSEFRKNKGYKVDRFMSGSDHKEFDSWLEDKVKSG